MMNHELQQVWYFCFRNSPAPDLLSNANFTLTLSPSNRATRLKLHRLALPVWRLDCTNSCPILNLKFWRESPDGFRYPGQIPLNQPHLMALRRPATLANVVHIRRGQSAFPWRINILNNLSSSIYLMRCLLAISIHPELALVIGGCRIYHKGCDSM